MDQFSQTLHVIYQTLLIVGELGVLAQVVLGFAHGGGHHGGHGHEGGHAGHADVHGAASAGAAHHGGGHSHDAGHAHDANHHGDGGKGTAHESGGPSPLWNLFSPLTIFSLALGAGGAGLLALLYLAPMWSIPLAALGGGAFYRLAVRPIWALIFRFASQPSQALEGTTGKSAEAVSSFDARGRGVVRLSVDGQSVRVLARLDPDDVAAGATVRPGDTLVVTQVDARNNACTVTRL